MPRLIIKLSYQKSHIFPITEGETVVGRGEDCGLTLPNVSVSREHARFLVGRQNVTVEDLDSQNGITVNGKATKQSALNSGDEIQIGRFTLVYLTDSKANRFYKGRCLDYMPRYAPGAMSEEQQHQATFAMTAEMLQKLQQDNHLVESARVLREEDSTRFWFPEDKGLSFGQGGQVHVDGWLAWGVVAELDWDGKQHLIRLTTSWRAKLTVNNQATVKRPLRHGDRFTLAGSRFRYDAPA